MPRDLNLAAVGNCFVAALIDHQARIVWWRLPRLDGDPVFCGLLDGDAERGVATVEADGTRLRVTDFCPRFRRFDRIYRAPMLIRRIEPEGGPCRVTIRLRPPYGYGAGAPTRILGSNHLRFVSADWPFRVTTDAPIAYLAAEAPFVLTHPVTLIFGPDESLEASIAHTAHDFLERTRDHWIEWTRYLAVPFEWQDAVIRAAISLKLCSCEETGAIVAALTTSIPEAPGTVRNWDYRHCWLRDAFFVVPPRARSGPSSSWGRSTASCARRNSFVGTLGGGELDASTLLLQEIGLVAASDPRFVATVDTIGKELVRGNLLLRYATADDFGVPETAFTICSFWYADALAAIGRPQEARERAVLRPAAPSQSRGPAVRGHRRRHR